MPLLCLVISQSPTLRQDVTLSTLLNHKHTCACSGPRCRNSTNPPLKTLASPIHLLGLSYVVPPPGQSAGCLDSSSALISYSQIHSITCCLPEVNPFEGWALHFKPSGKYGDILTSHHASLYACITFRLTSNCCRPCHAGLAHGEVTS
jgi:hypothetical protein